MTEDRAAAFGFRLRRRLAVLTLKETRASVRTRRQWGLAAAVAVLVGLVALWVGGMLTVVPTQGTYTVEIIWWGPNAGWFYPELLIVQSFGIVQLPWFPTLAMLVVAGGAGLGTTASVGLLRRALAARRQRRASGEVGGVAAGAGPGVVALATLGACCCTGCTATGGLALVAAVSGSSAGQLVELGWFLPLYQLAIVYVALLAQERAVRRSREASLVPAPLGARSLAGVALRIGLLIAGITWSLAMFVEWGSTDIWTAPAGLWYHWLFEHQLLAGLALAAALFPDELASFAVRSARGIGGRAVRAGWALAAFTWGVGVPPALVALGLGGLVNELLGGPGAGGWTAALAFHYAFQHALLSAFAMVFAVRPELAVRPLLWSTARPEGRPVAGSVVAPGARGSHRAGVGSSAFPRPGVLRGPAASESTAPPDAPPPVFLDPPASG